MFEIALGNVGSVVVETTHNRGFTPEELAKRAADKIVYVGSNSHPLIRDQAEAFKESVQHVVLSYLQQAVKQDRVTLANRFCEAGHPELVKLLEN